MSEKKEDGAYNLRKVFERIELELVQSLRRNMKRHEKEEEKEGFRWEMWQKAKLRNLQKYREENKDIVDGISPEIERIVNEALDDNYQRGQNLFSRILDKIKSIFFKKRRVQFPKDISHHKVTTPPPQENNFFGVNARKLEVLQEEAEKARKAEEEKPEAGNKPPPKPDEPLQKEPEQPKSTQSKETQQQKQSQPEEKPPEKPPEKPKEKQPPSQPEEQPFRPEGKEKDLSGTTNDTKLDDMKESVVHDLKDVQKAIWRHMDDVYRRTIYNAEMHMAAGAKTLDQAIDMATKEFLDAGINCIEYSNGRRVNIASYAEMALRTASHRATLLGEGKKRDEWGIHTVVVSAHANTCPLCAPWQGKILVDDVFCSGTTEEAERLGYPLMSTAMKAGLLHPNCRHTISTFFPGVSRPPRVPDSQKAIDTYRAEQKQRELERKIRKWKRKAEGSCDPENVNHANKKVGQYQDELRKYLKGHKELRRDYSREKTRGIASNGSAASKDAYENFNKEHLAKDASDLLPNLENASIPDAKITGYALNKNHLKGKDKAIAFEKSLGYNIDNKDELLNEVSKGLKRYKCSKRAATQYGEPYEVAMVIKGANGKYAKVKTGWIINHGSDIPRLTTIYVDN